MMIPASRARQLLVIGLVMLILMTGVTNSPRSVVERPTTRQTLSDSPRIYSGGTVEQIEIVEYNTLTAALDAVDAGDADLFGQMISPADYAAVDSHAHLKKQWAYDSMAVILTMNFDYYPLNSEHLRRAIAYAVDKNNITENFPRTVDPADFLMPLNNPHSLESSEGGMFYDALLSNATNEFVLAGMLDIDDDGFVEAPNGADFSLTIAVPADVTGMNMTATNILDDLHAVGLNVTLWYTNSSYLQSALANHTLDYQLALYTIDYPDYDAGWGVMTFESTKKGLDDENVANFDDSEYDSMISDYIRNYDPVQRESLMRDSFRMLRDKAPIIPLFFYRWLSVYSDANFEGWIDDRNAGAYSVWNPVQIHAKGSTTTLKVAVLPSYFDNFCTSLNPFKTGHVLDNSWLWKNQFNPYMLIYDSPLATLPNGSLVPREAASWQIVLPGMVAGLGNNESRAVFFSDPIANFTDGTYVSGQDYRYTFDIYANNSLIPYDLEYVETKVVGDYQAGITIKGIHPYLYSLLGQMPILPRHIWANKSLTTWNPSIDDVVGSGPYKVKSFTPGSKLVLTINSGYYPVEDTQAPKLISVSISPDDPIPAVSVTIRVYIYDRSKIDSVILSYTYDSGKLNFTESIEMTETSTGFTAIIPQHLTASFVNYSIRATDAWGNSAIITTGYYDLSSTSRGASWLSPQVMLGIGLVVLLVVVGAAIKRRH
ncbi:MAG: ABC transporter substrate-binding protein [Candidatus Thorarchaeota archaeon]|nr:ABC transporter substrate-binding protein [Candidatus Thorarchaeota archaeon]